VLNELGLSEGEIKVYLALLKLGSIPVSKIKEETNLHRTTIYDFVEKLLNKGLISYVIKNNVKYYRATHPNKLAEFLKEKQEHLEKILPELNKLAKLKKEEVKIEVYKGKEGLKTIMLECLRIGKEVVGMGIDDIYWKKALPIFIEQYQRMLKEKNMHERILTKINPEYLFDQTNTHYKFIPAGYFSPTSTLIYGNKVQIVLWEPSLTTLLIENKKLAEAYRKHFEILWKQESMIFRGKEEVKSVFEDQIATLKKEQEYLAFGIPPSSDVWVDLFDELCLRLGKKQVKTRVILDERAKAQIKMSKKHKLVKIKTLPKEHMTPAEIEIYGNKIAIVLWEKELQAIVIDNKKIADSFRKYFELLWKIAK